MKKIARNLQDLVSIFTILKVKITKEPLMIDIEPLFNKRTNPQLRAYWLLIKVCRLFMNSKGNNLTDKEVDYYFKIKAGHYSELDGVKMPKSIDAKSFTTKEDMEKLINTILNFGCENEIEDCYIESYEMQNLLKNYENKC